MSAPLSLTRAAVVLIACQLCCTLTTAAPPPCSILIQRVTVGGARAGGFVGDATPSVSWALAASTLLSSLPASQSFYQVTSSNGWDTGRIKDATSLQVPWSPSHALSSDSPSNVTVSVWDEAGRGCPPVTASFRTSLLAASDWEDSDWIAASNARPVNACTTYQTSPAPMLRGEFTLPAGTVSEATLHVVGLGWATTTVNGHTVSPVLDPAWTTYSNRVLFSSLPVADTLVAGGTNVIGVVLGNGWWNMHPDLQLFQRFRLRDVLITGPPRLRLVLTGSVADSATGTSTQFRFTSSATGSDMVWTCSTTASPIRQNSVYMGEVYDARFDAAIAGWDTPQFTPPSPSDWAPCVGAEDSAVTVAGRPMTGSLPTPTFSVVPPVAVVGTVDPVAVWEVSNMPGTYVVDMGAEFVGWMQLTVDGRGHQGETIQMLYGERLLAEDIPHRRVDGASIYPGQLGRWCDKSSSCAHGWGECAYDWPLLGNRTTGSVIDLYTMTGAANETYHAQFTFRPIRFVQINGWPAGSAPTVHDFVGLITSNDFEFASTRWGGADSPGDHGFVSSSSLLNAIDSLSYGSFRSNWIGIQSDCPGRERLGYGGDMMTSDETGMMMSGDANQFYVKRVHDYMDAQDPSNGGLPETAPYVGIKACSMGGTSGPSQWGSGMLQTVDALTRVGGVVVTDPAVYASAGAWVQLLMDTAASGPHPYLLYNALVAGVEPIYGCGSEQGGFLGTTVLIQQARMMAAWAVRLGNHADAAHYTAYAANASAAFAAHFQHNRTLGNATNDEFLMAFGPGNVVATPDFVASFKNTVNNQGGVLNLSAFGTWLSAIMADVGLGDELTRWLFMEVEPSYGWFLKNPTIAATTMMEHWNTPSTNDSLNHAWLNGVSRTFRQTYGGIVPDSNAMGWSSFSVRPWVTLRNDPTSASPALTFVNTTVPTPRGDISTAWRLTGSAAPFKLVLEVYLPVNTESVVWVPLGTGAAPASSVTASCDAPVVNSNVTLGGAQWTTFKTSGIPFCVFQSVVSQ